MIRGTKRKEGRVTLLGIVHILLLVLLMAFAIAGIEIMKPPISEPANQFVTPALGHRQ